MASVIFKFLSFIMLFHISHAFFVGHLAKSPFVTSSSQTILSKSSSYSSIQQIKNTNELKMGFVDDAFRFFTNLNKEASAKHILIKGPDASKKLNLLKAELANSTDISEDFSKLALKVCKDISYLI